MFRVIIAVFTMELLCPCSASANPAAVIAAGANTATAKVKGPVVFEISVIEGDIEIVAGAKDKVEIEVKVKGGKHRSVSLRQRGKRVTAEFGGISGLRRGDVRVVLPPGSEAHVQVVSGDVKVSGLGGDVEVSAVSGDIEVTGAANVQVEAVSGDVALRGIKGAIEIETVSGDAKVMAAAGAKGKFEFETTSGDLDWSGTCGSGCRMDLESLSGRATLRMAAKSSFDLDIESFSGTMKDKLGVKKIRESKGHRGMGYELEARYGKGAGKISFESHSGRLVLEKK